MTVSGTSFSCPYIAGVAALYFEEKGYAKSIGKPAVSNVGKTLKSRLVTYANSLKWYSGNNDNEADFAPLIQQGGGMVDAYLTASVGETTVEPSYIVVNSSHDPLQSNFFDITVTNTYDIDAKYTIDSKPHLVVNSFDDSGNSNFSLHLWQLTMLGLIILSIHFHLLLVRVKLSKLKSSWTVTLSLSTHYTLERLFSILLLVAQ